KATPGMVGVRIMLNRGVSEDPADPGLNRILAAGARHGLPVNILGWGRLEQVKALAARNASTSIVLDHLGLQQPFEPPPPAQPWADVPKVLALAQMPHVAINITSPPPPPSRSPAPARSRARPIPTRTSGSLSGGSSRPSASSAVSGAPTGRARPGP